MSITQHTGDRVYTTKQLAKRLGLKRHQLNYLIDSGAIPDAQDRLAGRRMFTEQEAREIDRILTTRKQGKRGER